MSDRNAELAKERDYITSRFQAEAKTTATIRERIEQAGGWSEFDIPEADVHDYTWNAAEAKGAAEWLGAAWTLLNNNPEAQAAIRALCEAAESKSRLYTRMLLVANEKRYERFMAEREGK